MSEQKMEILEGSQRPYDIAEQDLQKPQSEIRDSDDTSSVSTKTSSLEEHNEEDEEEEVTWSVALRPRNLYKLVTHEDRFNIHKLVGVVCLTHFIFRLVSLVVRGTMGFEYETQGRLIFWFGVHLLLSWSSFIFHLPPRRNQIKPMIWPELRLHNVVFATRSILDALLHILGLGTIAPLRVAIALVAMVAADMVTNHYKKLQLISNTTMRGMPFPKDTSKTMIDRVNLYYAMSQLFATAGVINISRNWKTDVELAFLTLFAVQLSALLMTLVRKSVLEPAGWHLCYGISLGLSWVLAFIRYTERDPLPSAAKMLTGMYVLYLIRFRFNANKYALWIIFAFGDMFFMQKPYFDFPFGENGFLSSILA